ncbi:MAG: cytochrome c oxidase subunit II [Solirubrobacteraceae bacterium]
MSDAGSTWGIAALSMAAARPSTYRAYSHVWGIYMPIAVGVFAFIVLMLAVLLVRGARRQRAGIRSEATHLEGAYAAGLACVAAFLVYVTFSTETPIDSPVSHPSLTVRVIAAQWSWRFEYPDGVVVVDSATWKPKPIYVPTGVEVEYTGTSRDVLHGFWVPRLHFQRQFLPGYVSTFDLLFETPGYYLGECSVYCGQRHSQMHFAIRAVSRAAYSRWLAAEARAQKAKPHPEIEADAIRAGERS